MTPHDPTLERLLREVEQSRLWEAVFEATGEVLMAWAKDISQAVEQKVRQATAQGELMAAD